MLTRGLFYIISTQKWYFFKDLSKVGVKLSSENKVECDVNQAQLTNNILSHNKIRRIKMHNGFNGHTNRWRKGREDVFAYDRWR